LKECKIPIIVGPTAVGKTMLSLEIASSLDAEIISADSRQIYRFMNIGTAKPTSLELHQVRHHFIDIRDPDQEYSAGEYGREARRCIEKLLAQGKQPLVVGGSGFYLQALVDGLFAPPLSDPHIKDKWRRRIAEGGREEVFLLLKKIDPHTASRIHQNDTQRIVRALEVWELSGIPISHYRKGTESAADFQPCFWGLDRERENLYALIERRVDWMMKEGLVDEVRQLLQNGYHENLNALRTVGYQEVIAFLQNRSSEEEMTSMIKMNSRRYAKRQLTWFRRDARIHWLSLDELSLQQAGDMVVKDLFSKS